VVAVVELEMVVVVKHLRYRIILAVMEVLLVEVRPKTPLLEELAYNLALHLVVLVMMVGMELAALVVEAVVLEHLVQMQQARPLLETVEMASNKY